MSHTDNTNTEGISKRYKIEGGGSWQLSEFFIFAGWPLEVDCPDDEGLIRELARAGFNVIMWDIGKLPLCRKYGLRLMVDHGPKGWEPPGEGRWARRWREYMRKVGTFTPDMATEFKEDPTVWGYQIQDEPTAEQFSDMVVQLKNLNNADPNHPAYINLLSGGGDYLEAFMEVVHPNLLSYDYYQWWWGRDGHFTNLEQYRNAALKADIPLFCWVEINANPDTERGTGAPPEDNSAKLRQSVYTSLAYGVKGVEWFTTPYLFEHGTAKLTPVAADVIAINAELKNLGPELIQLESKEVFHTGPLAADTNLLPVAFPVQTQTGELLLGVFDKASDEKAGYLMVVNRSIEEEKIADIRIARPMTSVEMLSKRSGQWNPIDIKKQDVGHSVAISLSPGDGELLRIEFQE